MDDIKYLRKDESGKKYNRLSVIRSAGKSADRKVLWLCKCDCGQLCSVEGNFLRSGRKIDCGCGESARRSGSQTTHGMSKTATYKSWCGMIERCENESNKRYSSYGGRGIRICDRWRQSFEFFVEDMGIRPDGLSLDRIDNNGDYEPSNCRWANARGQARNRRSNIWVEYQGDRLLISDWAKRLGIQRTTLEYRKKAGWTDKEIIETPLSAKRKP